MKKITLTLGLIGLSAGSVVTAACVTADTVFAIGKVGTGFFGMYYGGKLFVEKDQSLGNKVIGTSVFLAGASLACNKEQEALALVSRGVTYAGKRSLKFISKLPTSSPIVTENTVSPVIHTPSQRAAVDSIAAATTPASSPDPIQTSHTRIATMESLDRVTPPVKETHTPYATQS